MGSLGSRHGARLSLATIAAISVALWIHAPSLDGGFRADDYVHAAILRGEFPVERSPLDLFNFTSSTRQDRERLLDFGYLPWWTASEISLRMWRPLSSALIALDHQTFGLHARPMHAHSLLWLAALIASAALVLRKLATPTTCALALLLFALQPAHSVPVGWLANRNTLVATTLGFLAVAAYLRFRDGGRWQHGLAASCFAITALAAGEYALSALAYVAAYELFGDGAWRTRLRALLPVAVPALAYVALHSWIGADVIGSGYYISPVRAPLAFGEAVLTRVPVLVADLVLGVPSAYYALGAPLKSWLLSLQLFSPRQWQTLPDWAPLHTILGYASIAFATWLVRALMRSSAAAERQRIGTLAVGTLLALVPVAGSLPGDRLLAAGALGYCALAAMLLTQLGPWAWRSLTHPRRLGRSLLALSIVGLCFAHGAVRARGQAVFFSAESESLRVWGLHAELPERSAAQARVYVLASADFTTSANLPWLRRVHGLPLSRSYRRLGAATAAMDLRRVDERSVDMIALSAELQHNAVPSLYRDREHPLRAGDRFTLPGLSVHVLRAHRGNPMAVRFAFDRSLDDDSLWFLHSTVVGLRRVRMPEIGQTLRLPRPVMTNLRAMGVAPPGDFSE